MDDETLLNAVTDNQDEWTDEQIGTFVRRALTEDITREDLEKEMGLDAGWRLGN
jgi:hypothetical protein